MTRPLPLTLGLLSLLLSACGDDAPLDATPKEDRLVYELFPSTRLLDASALGALQAVEPSGRLRFDPAPAALADVARLQVLLAPAHAKAPAGLLRLVTAVRREGGALELDTTEAPVQLAFRRLSASFTRRIEEASRLGFTPVGRLGTSRRGLWAETELSEAVFDGDGKLETKDDQVWLEGSLAGGFDYDFGLEVDWGDVTAIPEQVLTCLEEVLNLSFDCSPASLLPEAKVGFGLKAGAEAKMHLSGVAFLGYSSEYPFAEAKLDPIVIGPLVFLPTVEVRAAFSGSASSRFELSTEANATLQAGMSYSSKTGGTLTPPSFTRSFDAPSVNATLGAEAKVRVGPRLHLRLYDVLGPYASLYAFAAVSAEVGRTPCWRLTGGLEGDVGVSIRTPDLPLVGALTLASYDETFGLAETEIASGACIPPAHGDAPQGHAGSFTPAAFASPDFEPWAKTYVGVAQGTPVEGPGAQLEWSSLEPTIDGRFLLSGSDTPVLTKLDKEGHVIWARRFETTTPYADGNLRPEFLPGRIVASGRGTTFVILHPYTVLELTASGEVLAAKHFLTPVFQNSWLRFTDAVPDGAGGLYVVGTVGDSQLDPIPSADVWLLRLDAELGVLWSHTLGSPGSGEAPRGLLPLSDGVLVVGSALAAGESRWRGLVARYGVDGQLVFQREVVADDCGETEDRVHLLKAVQLRDGDLLLAGQIQRGNYSTLLVKLGPAGQLEWFRSARTAEPEAPGPWLTDVVELPTSGFLGVGTYRTAEASDDVFIAAFDVVGEAQWMRRFGGRHGGGGGDLRYDDTYPSLVLTDDGGALVSAFTKAFGAENSALVAKLPAKDGRLEFAAASRGAQVAVSPGSYAGCLRVGEAGWGDAERPVSWRWVPVTASPVEVPMSSEAP